MPNTKVIDRRDRRLMKDMLRYPATRFFRDEHIVIIQPLDERSYEFWSPTGSTTPWDRINKDYTNTYIVRTNSKEYFEVKKSASTIAGGGFNFGESAYLDAYVPKGEFATIKTYKRSIAEYLKKYPSLYDAFEEIAIKMAYLPLLREQTDKSIWEALEADPRNLSYVKNLTHKRKVQILKRWPACIKSMGQTQELCDLVVKDDAANISYVDEIYRNQKMCENAVKEYASALQYVPNQTEKICLAAVKRDATALQYVKKPTMKVYVAAVNRDPSAWNLIKKEKLRKQIRKAKKQKKYQT